MHFWLGLSGGGGGGGGGNGVSFTGTIGTTKRFGVETSPVV